MIDTTLPNNRRIGINAPLVELGFFALMVIVACAGF